jgi:hypothetical protein
VAFLIEHDRGLNVRDWKYLACPSRVHRHTRRAASSGVIPHTHRSWKGRLRQAHFTAGRRPESPRTGAATQTAAGHSCGRRRVRHIPTQATRPAKVGAARTSVVQARHAAARSAANVPVAPPMRW